MVGKALECLVRCRRSFPAEWRRGEWGEPERGKCLRVARETPFFISQRKFSRREAVSASSLRKHGMTKAYGWLVEFICCRGHSRGNIRGGTQLAWGVLDQAAAMPRPRHMFPQDQQITSSAAGGMPSGAEQRLFALLEQQPCKTDCSCHQDHN